MLEFWLKLTRWKDYTQKYTDLILHRYIHMYSLCAYVLSVGMYLLLYAQYICTCSIHQMRSIIGIYAELYFQMSDQLDA